MLTLPGAKQIGRTAAGFAVALGCNDMVAASVKEFEDEACVALQLLRVSSGLPLPSATEQGVYFCYGGLPIMIYSVLSSSILDASQRSYRDHIPPTV